MARSRVAAAIAASLLAVSAEADFLGWTATVRQVQGGFLVNVFATTNDPGDVILNISGGSVGLPTEGYVRTVNIPGGFRQSTDAAAVFRPTSGQSWTSLDSFLTVGGGFDPASGTWSSNVVTQGDPPWVVTYADTQTGGPVSVNGFNVWSNSTGFTNPYVNAIPSTGGWFMAGVTSPARSLATIQSIRLPFEVIGGQRYGASSQAAANASHGFLVGQLWVPSLTNVGLGNSLIEWKMSANLRRPNGTISNASAEFRIKGTIEPDLDGDGIPNSQDPCPEVAGPCNGCPANACGTCGPLPDADGDGRPDCQDNCPAIANPQQTDCNGNGIGDACETFTDCNGNGTPDSCDIANGSALDCNSNGRPDSCDIAGGAALDCNSNGVPDACDIAFGTSNDVDENGIPDDCKPDCNGNGLPDAWEISTGRVPDCNADLVPDTCQGAVEVGQESPNLGPPSGSDIREHAFGTLPFAATPVTLSVDVRGDLDGQTEYIDVILNDSAPRRFFAIDGDDCPATPNRATITLLPAEFNQLIAPTAVLVVRVACPSTVDASECKANGLTVLKLRYVGIGPKGDCNGTLTLDVCDVATGTPDCNANLVPDSCDIARGLVPDCNSNGVPDPCEVASNPAIDCNGNGVPDSCDIATGGLAVDCDSNGRLDSCQVVENPASDCNANGKPDSCDIAGGVSFDIDGNGRPDECQTVRVPLEFPTIQAAIDSAPSNEMRIILVAAGTHAGPIDFVGKPVIVRGAGAESTVIQGGGTGKSAVVRFSGGESAIASLERVTVRGGMTGTQPPGMPYFAGGGVYGRQSEANVRQCIIEGNTAGVGGGIYLENCDSIISSTVIRSNAAASDGGGVVAIGGTVAVTDCTIQSNGSGGRGGGAHFRGGQPILTRVMILENDGGTVAGGLSWIPGSAAGSFLVLDDCQITGNSAGIAQGGIGILGSSASAISLEETAVCSNSPRPNIAGSWTDLGGNTVCTCTGDLDGDERVSGDDLGIMLGHWGACVATTCPADLNGDSTVDGDDLGLLLGNWGPCAP